jgi:hypothetical protein
MFTRIMACLMLGALVTGCAANAQRIGVFPTQRQDGTKQAGDVFDCNAIALGKAGDKTDEALTKTGTRVVVGATFGAMLGAVAGAFLGSAGEGAALGAALGGAVGGIGGLTGGAASNQQAFEANYAVCLHAATRLGVDRMINVTTGG